jgi:hypothetical protein
MLAQHALNGFSTDQWCIAAEDQHRAAEVGQLFPRTQYGMTGA